MAMQRFHYILIIAAALVFSGCNRQSDDRVFSEKMGFYLDQIREGLPPADGIMIYNPEMILHLYDTEKEFVVAKWDNWENVDQMLNSIRNSYYHGLRPGDYHLSAIYDHINMLASSRDADPARQAAFDLLLTDSFLLLGAHLAAGKVDPLAGEPRWSASGVDIGQDWLELMEESLAKGQVARNLRKLAPLHDEYTELMESLAWHRRIERNDGWKLFLPETPLEKGVRHDDVVLLRERLDPFMEHRPGDTSDKDLFDDRLHRQVKLFQRTNGLEAHGVVDRATVEAMNISVYDRISVIKANLDRWRRLDYPGDHYIAVNIPEFELSYVKGGKNILTMPVILGKPDRQTPVFSSEITRIEFNPFWFVPPGMLRRTILPAVRRDSTYLEKRNMEVLDQDWRPVDPGSIDWNSVPGNEFPFIIRQRPGPGNEMGQVKFLFPNRHFVTIHGTPYLHLFNRTARALSNGCIRVRTPIQLAAAMLDGQDDLTMENILEILDTEEFTRVNIDNPLRLHVFYFTAWAGEEGQTHFRDDVYSLDQDLIAAIEQLPPYPEQPLRIEYPSGMATIGETEDSGDE